MSDLKALRDLERARAYATGRLAAAAHGVLAAHNESDAALLSSHTLGHLHDALRAYDAAERNLIAYLATPLEVFP